MEAQEYTRGVPAPQWSKKKKKKLKEMPFSEESEKGQEEQFHFTASPILQGRPAQSQETPWSTVSPLGKQTESLLPPPLQDAAQKATLSVPPRTQRQSAQLNTV